jgi:mannose-6-phosphate isomerase-like protein (cupin superfamily)
MAERYDLNQAAKGDGPVLGGASADLNFTLLSWSDGHTIGRHINDEVDVLMIVLGGRGEAMIGEERFDLAEGHAVLIPKGVEREIRSLSDGFRYLNVHTRRRLMPKGL